MSVMIDSASRWIREVIQLALVVVALGVVLQILFPQALVFINSDVTGNLINLIGTFSGAGLIGLIAFGLVYTIIRR